MLVVTTSLNWFQNTLAGGSNRCRNRILPWDSEKAMMGDTGANALGAALEFCNGSFITCLAQIAVLLALAFLNLASERVSFSRIIAQNRIEVA